MSRYILLYDSNDRVPQPGDLLCVVHADTRNRQCDVVFASDRGGPDRLDGYHTMSTSQAFDFVPDADVQLVHPSGESLLAGDKAHYVLGRTDGGTSTTS